MKDPGDSVERILAAPRTGTYHLDEDGDLTFAQVSNDWHEITGEDEAFFLRVYGPGDFRFHGADWASWSLRGGCRPRRGSPTLPAVHRGIPQPLSIGATAESPPP